MKTPVRVFAWAGGTKAKLIAKPPPIMSIGREQMREDAAKIYHFLCSVIPSGTFEEIMNLFRKRDDYY